MRRITASECLLPLCGQGVVKARLIKGRLAALCEPACVRCGRLTWAELTNLMPFLNIPFMDWTKAQMVRPLFIQSYSLDK